MGAAASRYLAFVADTLFAEDAEAHALVTGDGGACCGGGEERDNHDLADTLDRLAAEGPALFTAGDVGRALVATWPSTAAWSRPRTWRRTSRSCGPRTSPWPATGPSR